MDSPGWKRGWRTERCCHFKASRSAQELQQSTLEFSLALKEGAKRVAEDCRGGVEKLTQKFKT
ncbi:uncharacterized protein Pyn_01003 [Prunus yedoensis var. nudiflora]|uniref:Uncharacterized protein n=1 Tax=Prunus yedoensis var. nudiflora TaxID=2094558 RepID=A0A314UP64_PRUYE|nr:uncharacterized protein Pyn_01003 [Prunus yedoensis var. nudiflora]